MRSAAKGAGRTGHAAPSPDPARAGGRAGTAEGRARRGPTCRLLPPPPCAHKAPRAPGRPRRRRRRRDPAPAGLPGPRGRERPRIPMRAGTWARPHPPTHPSAGAGPRGTPSRNEALPGAFKVARFRIGYPLPSPVLPLRSPLSRIYEIPNLSGSGWSQPQRPPIPNCPTQTSAWIRESRFQTPTAASPPRLGERALSRTPSDWKNLRCLPTAFGVSSLSPSPFETTSHEDSTRRRLAGVMRGVDVHRLVLEPPLFLVE